MQRSATHWMSGVLNRYDFTTSGYNDTTGRHARARRSDLAVADKEQTAPAAVCCTPVTDMSIVVRSRYSRQHAMNLTL
ncbi:hypothetical protein RSOLAG1IB_09700 [Rhizoctonia solani AG-1 IB]|uniref:Uncharacterized protein n=1 Tax=Thanatephorus cucumeris (strain AG1-IB / isolate 7/3/14) TaxID=1108050 RepID=A0A0B7FWA1_THACB|nr:hypothetical protein RSOLAG1IB_09700 [Rhizoctonia solani AG-1 IB]